jgi:amidase
MTPLGGGGDLGGSLRWPAQCCGICSLKPTLGRIPRGTTIEPADLPIASQLMMVEGPLARRVADLRAAFELMAGPPGVTRGRCRRRCAVPNRPDPRGDEAGEDGREDRRSR